MMDKRTIAVMLACMLALFALQFVTNKIFPPVPKRTPPPAAAVTNAVSNVVAEVVAPAPTNVPPPVTQVERPAEQTLALSNEFIRVEFTSWGGGIRRVELLKHNANGHGHITLNADAPTAALALAGVTDADTNAVFSLEQTGTATVVMRAGNVTKTVTLGKDYLLTGEIECSGASTLGVVVGTAGATHLKEAALYLNADWQDGPKWNNRDLSVVAKRAGKGQNREPIHARWVAVKSQYFAMVLTGGTNATTVTYAPVTLPPPAEWTAKEPPQGVTAVGEWPAANGKLSFSLYAGPKEYERLSALGQSQMEVMDFGSWMDGYTGVFGLVLFKSMVWCHKLMPNYGVAIILVTILLRIVFWPIQAKSIKSMKEMQKFQPQMQKVREKYKDDQQRQNQEIMKLYKEHKINPFSGCLPMLVQLPVLIAFYKVLSNAIELRGTSFLWIKDLALPDTVATVMGIPINPLPIIMTGCTVWQQKMTPSTGDAQQQKMMMFMPLVMLFFFYPSASGLVLYWTVQQVLSMAQQWWSMRQPADAPAQ
jgi:YidC/Oxa1 family membrane protein insertase